MERDADRASEEFATPQLEVRDVPEIEHNESNRSSLRLDDFRMDGEEERRNSCGEEDTTSIPAAVPVTSSPSPASPAAAASNDVLSPPSTALAQSVSPEITISAASPVTRPLDPQEPAMGTPVLRAATVVPATTATRVPSITIEDITVAESPPPTLLGGPASPAVLPQDPGLPKCQLLSSSNFVEWKPEPQEHVCQFCRAEMTTRTKYRTGVATYLSMAVLCVGGCFLGCCFAPLGINRVKDVEHNCSQCHKPVGLLTRI
eukprot:TRINITY_DN6158_c0_g1_i1.p1 TRINITY_DN6158_c0_g1~~TRINITY_DN6158_c0_g1_i1.p1  ORF type:complete len:260 (+),score=41.12 TRINITY_DN6158_c0_g1_i1:121-900(+)